MDVIDTIQSMKSSGCFENYVDFIQFPVFKNLEANTRINFDFPLTVLIGKNGSNKSSVLTALYGVPKGNSTGTFWFSTETDPINESDRGRNRYFYQYTENRTSQAKEVLKHRMRRADDPDYWETSDPVISIGMKDKRKNSPVNKNVVYIDFRGQLSAFDKYFYFGEPRNGKKQDFLRKKSIYLKRAFENTDPRVPGRNGKQMGMYALKHRINIDKIEINEINRILGKNYESIVIVEHKLYDKLGSSALIKSQNAKNELKYSEANAGSGETAVIQLVHKVMNAKEFSLILLDEPEVSLHPSAQKRIQEFLLAEIKKHKHQVVISTHSPALIKGLPKTAIKLFSTNADGYFRVEENIDYRTAFYELEEYVTDKKIIICEDIDAKNLIDRTLRNMNLEKHFTVNFAHGGADTLLNHIIPMYAINQEMKSNVFFILDGDKFCHRENSREFSVSQIEDIDFLKAMVKSVYSGNLLEVFPDGGAAGGRVDQECEIYRQYIDYHYNNVSYLPNKKIPEEIVLGSEYVRERYRAIIERYSPITSQNAKKVLWEIKEERADGEVEKTFEALSYELFRENEISKNGDIENLRETLRSIFDTGSVYNKILSGSTV